MGVIIMVGATENFNHKEFYKNVSVNLKYEIQYSVCKYRAEPKTIQYDDME